MVSLIYVPPLTVASLAITITSFPCIIPIPVTIPADGNCSLYCPYAASGLSSIKGVFGSSSRLMRWRTSSFSRAWCFSLAAVAPPMVTDLSLDLNKSMRSLFSFCLSRKESECISIFEIRVFKIILGYVVFIWINF